jgi:hypothetical protein
MKMIKKIIDVAHHRNGVCGTPFDVVLFTDKDTGQKMVGIVPNDDENTRNAFVLSVDRMVQDNIRFAENSWRGDNYVNELKQAIEVTR